MSIDLNWETVTGGPDGQALAEKIRDFIHTKFQQVPLPRFIKSVKVHDFQFGTIPPEIELKDITDPLPDFYEDNVDSDAASDSEEDIIRRSTPQTPDRRSRAESRHGNVTPHQGLGSPGNQSRYGDMSSPFLRVSTPGIPGGTSNLHYFHPHLASGLSGTQTPLAAVAGAQHLGPAPWLDSHHSSSMSNLRGYPGPSESRDGSPRRYPSGPRHSRNHSGSSISLPDNSPPLKPVLQPPGPNSQSTNNLTIPLLREKHSVSTLAPTSAGASRPPTRDRDSADPGSFSSFQQFQQRQQQQQQQQTTSKSQTSQPPPPKQPESPPPPSNPRRQPRFREPRVDDMQAVFRIRYAGDVKLLLTADILLDYPMPSFVGIPVRLSITGLTFDGVGVLAKIRRRVHFCFLSPEDAVAAVGGDVDDGGNGGSGGAESDGDEPVTVPAGGGIGAGGNSNSRPGSRSGNVAGLGGQHRRRTSTQGSAGLGRGPPTAATAKFGGLLQEIRVESEIGQRESGKQSLKNVGKVERFVLEQVRRIFEEEFVYPSFWTFLV
ncbi:hypothetical protein VTJ04DRAFT_1596 [Mycothermus thermophilus]|uniref:uncharacterized protein n=1 Tax=Humicola insolens TaxID=85995 RepID=UPI003743ED28